MLSASATVHVGVFAWGADGRVVRFYPNEKVRNLIVPAGGRVSLPQDRRRCLRRIFGRRLCRATRRTMRRSSSSPRTSPSTSGIWDRWQAHNTAETMSVAIPAGIFLNALGELDLSQATLLILPYRVRRMKCRIPAAGECSNDDGEPAAAPSFSLSGCCCVTLDGRCRHLGPRRRLGWARAGGGGAQPGRGRGDCRQPRLRAPRRARGELRPSGRGRLPAAMSSMCSASIPRTSSTCATPARRRWRQPSATSAATKGCSGAT